MKNTRVVPAILTDNASAVREMGRAMKGVADWVQVDIMDGEFVPSRSIGWQSVKAAKLSFDWEAHLMVREPESYFSGFKSAGARRVVFHYEATPDPAAVIAAAEKLGMEVGMALNPETTTEAAAPFLDRLDSVLLLSVNPGFYGAEYIPGVLDKVGELRALAPELHIGIDGGIKADNILEVAASGVDDICVGSGIFRAPDPVAAWRKLQTLVNEVTR